MPTKSERELEVEQRLHELETTRLLPCPFCGGLAHHIGIWQRSSRFVQCNVCNVLMTGRTEVSVAKAWNKRTANARAIAAHPDLLAGVEQMLAHEYDESPSAVDGWLYGWKMVKAAYTRATGQPTRSA